MGISVETVDASAQAVWRDLGRRSFRRDDVGYEFADILPMDPGVLEIQADGRDTYLVATLAGRPAGRLLIEEHRLDNGAPFSILRDVAVAPEARRRGVGRALVNEARRRFKAASGVISAETDLEDLTMYHFLNACGLQREPHDGFSAWVLMDYPYRPKTLERVAAVRKAGIEIRDPGIAGPDELAAAVWSRCSGGPGGADAPLRGVRRTDVLCLPGWHPHRHDPGLAAHQYLFERAFFPRPVRRHARVDREFPGTPADRSGHGLGPSPDGEFQS